MAASGGVFVVEYEDAERRAVLVGNALVSRTAWLRFHASAFNDRDDATSRFYIKRVESGWQVRLDGGGFPGTVRFDLELQISLAEAAPGKDRNPEDARLALTLTGPAFGTVTLTAESLNHLLGTDATILAVAPKGDAAARKLVDALFAGGLERGPARDLVLRLRRDLVWVVNGKMQARMGAKSAKGTGLMRLPASELFFAVVDGAPNADAPAGQAGTAVQVAGSAQRVAEVRALFAGINTDATPGAELYAWADGDAALGTLRFGTSDGVSTLISAIPAVCGTVSTVGWRMRRSGHLDMAVRAPMRLDVSRANAVASAAFAPLDGLVVAQPHDGGLAYTAFLGPRKSGADMSVTTPFGTFRVRSLPPLATRPGAKVRIPPIELGAIVEPRRAPTLTNFAAPFALEGCEAGLQNSEGAFAALRFDEAECLFHIGGVSCLRPRGGVAVNGADPPHGEALIDIGPRRAGGVPVRLSLDRAHLSLRRAKDLLALDYRFRDLILEGTANARDDRLDWRVTPDRRIADFRRDSQKAEVPQVPARDCEVRASSKRMALGAEHDARPIMVVEFPPQHIAEQAYPRQIAADPILPSPPQGTGPRETERDALLYGDVGTRLQVRNDVHTRQKQVDATAQQDIQDAQQAYLKFVSDFETAAKAVPGIPSDQRIYVGPAFLDPEAARVARSVARGPVPPAAPANANVSDGDVDYRLRGLPSVDLTKDVRDEMRREMGVPDNVLEDWTPVAGQSTPQVVEAYLRAREDLKGRGDYDYARFRLFWSGAANGKTPDLNKVSLEDLYLGRAATIQSVKSRGKTEREKTLSDIEGRLASWNDAIAKDPADVFADAPAEARVSGRSRLVFRIPADDFDTGEADAERQPAGSFPFSVKGLTDWGAFDLAVVRRAEKIFEPRPDGRAAQRWNRSETIDEVERLLHLGFTRGDRSAIAADEGRDCGPAPGTTGNVTSGQRLAEVVASARAAPAWDETSIEFPFRLMLSPAQDATWLTPLAVPLAALTPDASVPVPLWNARLDEAAGASSLRSVWSPDFRPDALVDRNLGGPPRGPWAPWAMARDITSHDPDYSSLERFRGVMDSYDRHELVILSSVHGLPVRGRRRLDGSLADTSQIEVPPGFRLRDAAFDSLRAKPDPTTADATIGDHSAIYRPRTLGASELTLTALGASFESDSDFEPPASAKVVSYGDMRGRTLSTRSANLFDALSIERWRHSAVLGRDTRVEIVYKGFLFPLGMRASLVKLSERRFLRRRPGGAPVAALVQRLFLRIAKPDRLYPGIGQPDDGRRWPVETLEILTKVTPDLLDPNDDVPPGRDRVVASTDGVFECVHGRLFLRGQRDTVRAGLVFWPRIAPGPAGDVQFELQIDGRGARVRMPLLFVDNTFVNDSDALQALVAYYNGLVPPPNPIAKFGDWLWTDKGEPLGERRRLMHHHGAKRRYAAETKPDDTSFETLFWEVQAEGTATAPARREGAGLAVNYVMKNDTFDFSPVLQGADQPPFYPVVRRALVRIAQIDRLVGSTTAPVTVRFDPQYQAFGFPSAETLRTGVNGPREATNDVYIDFEGTVSFNPGAAGDRTGGATRPSSDFAVLSRSRGPMGLTPDVPKPPAVGAPAVVAPAPAPGAPAALSAHLDTPSLASLFNLEAKILGILSFSQALKLLTGTFASTPAFREVTEYGSALLADANSTAAEAVSKIRDSLLVPLLSALDTVTGDFARSLGKDTTAAQAQVALARLYPQVGTAHADMHDALNAAIDASASASDVGSLLGHFAEIYAAGRRFLSAIERVARDPISPVKQAVKDAFAAEVNRLLGDVDAIRTELDAAVGALAKSAATQVEQLFDDKTVGVWVRLVFALPFSVDEDVADDVRTAVDAALSAALGKGNWVEPLKRRRLDDSAKAISDDFVVALRADVHGKAHDVRDATEVALGFWLAQEHSIEGLLYAKVFGGLSEILATAATIGSDLGALDLATVSARIAHLASAAVGLAAPDLAAIGAAAANGICAPAMVLLADVVDIVAPRLGKAADTGAKALSNAMTALTEAGTDLDNTLDIVLQGLAQGLPTDPEIASPSAAKLVLLKFKLQTYLAAVDDAGKKALDAQNAIDDAVVAFLSVSDQFGAQACTWTKPGDLAQKPVEALNALARPRRRLAAALAALVTAISDLTFIEGRDLVNGTLGIPAGDDAAISASLPPDLDDAVTAVRVFVARAAALTELVGRLARETSALKSNQVGTPTIDARLQAASKAAEGLAVLVQKAEGDRGVIEAGILGPLGAIAKFRNDQAVNVSDHVDALATLGKLAADADKETVAVFIRRIAELGSASLALGTDVDRIASTLIADLELAAMHGLAEAIAAGNQVRDAILGRAFSLLQPAVSILATVQTKIVASRNSIFEGLTTGAAGEEDPQSLAAFGKGLGELAAAGLRRNFLVVRPASVTRPPLVPSPEKKDPSGEGDDFLTAEAAELDHLAAVLKTAPLVPADVALATGLFADWAAGHASVLLLKDQLAQAGQAILSGQLTRIVDLEDVRRKVDAKLKEMVPSKVSLTYDMKVDLGPVGGIFLPEPGSQLTLAAAASYDLLTPTTAPRFTSMATLDAFAIDLFDVVTFKFDGATFSNDNEKGSHFAVAYNDFVLGSKAEFLKPLQKMLNPQGSGPYVVPAKGFPGIEAGFSLALGVISIGSLSFANVSINAACRLPFDNRQAVFVVSIGRRDKPFLISCLPYTGGGYLALLATSKKMLGFEASFEFGGGGAFKAGPLEGQGRVTLGIFVSQVESVDDDGPQGCTIEGFFYAGGEAHIACFSLSASLSVRISQQPGGAMHGTAIFTFSFSMGIADIHYQVAFTKTEGKGFSGSNASSALTPPTRYASNAPAYLADDTTAARLTSLAASMASDWKAHRRYFAADLDGFPA